MARDLLYRGYRLFVVRSGAGWRVLIHAPGSAYPSGEIGSEGSTGLDSAIAQAKELVDRLIASCAR